MADLFYSRAGQGEPLLILHGLFGSSRNWQSLARQYAGHFDVISVDLRNHGQSFHAPQMDYRVMAEDVSALINSVDVADCLVIGHSMGGKVALQLAIDQPQLLKRMVIADIAPVSYRHDHNATLEALMAVELEQVNSRADADQQMQAYIPEAALRAFLLQNLVRQDSHWQWRVNLDAIESHMAELTSFQLPAAKFIDLPALFIYGTRSNYVGETEKTVIQQQFRRAKLLPIEGAGHWLHAEKPDIFLQATLDYLKA